MPNMPKNKRKMPHLPPEIPGTTGTTERNKTEETKTGSKKATAKEERANPQGPIRQNTAEGDIDSIRNNTTPLPRMQMSKKRRTRRSDTIDQQRGGLDRNKPSTDQQRGGLDRKQTVTSNSTTTQGGSLKEQQELNRSTIQESNPS
jgi:hypothetical protein